MTRNRENWQSGPENVKRGEDWLGQIYKHNIGFADSRFEAQKDFCKHRLFRVPENGDKLYDRQILINSALITRELSYGFYLSDHSILGPVETELVVLSGIMIQNLPLETAWHLRGCRRVGMSSEEVEGVQKCVGLFSNPDIELVKCFQC